MSAIGATGRALRGDRATLAAGAGLLLVTVAAWAGVLARVRPPAPAETRADAAVLAGGGPAGLVAFVAAWTVMMVAMMLPSASPLVLLYRAAGGGGSIGNTLPLVGGYLLAWGLFGVPVFLVQQALVLAAASPAVADTLPYGVTVVLVGAGVYQFTALKEVCLRQCRSPLDFLVQHWRPGPLGALRLGIEHGGYCVGCCWGLMAVLVAAGAMGLAWLALLALVVFAEKLLPGGQWAARAAGGMLVGLGASVALWPDLAMLLRGSMAR